MRGQVEVYFNLRKDIFSVRSGGLVVAHSRRVVLKDCTFVVQPAGLRKVRETGVKNVHAFVRGTELPNGQFFMPSEPAQRVRYNPFIFDTFVTVDEGREIGVHHADFVLCEIKIDKHPVMWAWWL